MDLSIQQKQTIYTFAQKLVESDKFAETISKFKKLESNSEFTVIKLNDPELKGLFGIENSQLRAVKEELAQALHEQPTFSFGAKKVKTLFNPGFIIIFIRE